MPALEVVGAYCSVGVFKAATNSQDTTRDAVILRHLRAASREIERLTQRRFFPVTATNSYRWPPYAIQPSWAIYTEDDLLSVTSLQVAAGGIGATPVTLTHYYLEPQFYGSPYNRVEVDLSSSDVLQAGPTPQRSVQITGQWGYCATTVPLGTITADLHLTDTSLTASVPAAIECGQVLLIDSEAIYVDSAAGTGVQVLRRGVNGTTAAAHTSGAAISRYEAPSDIERVVLADAIGSYQQDLASWGRTIGAGEMAVEYQGKMAKSLRQTVIDNYARRRTAAV